ncbi:AarF/UbiB family protein [Vibrio ostreicida]|uniref:AarF/UbiB family protein n=1 Tax=Vibrio ostreicida TaxID=526588 RepID=A0ABT8BVK5_9VIBR|nr:AarF/UbiB family protein [Vibrio ostreicida]MDN3610132.1 AarF/UbiB family protein [Vibrio ostreicida]NPD07843.1 protein kinase [Vibrio ostreicida]
MEINDQAETKTKMCFRVLGISQYSMLRNGTYLATHPCYGCTVIKFAQSVSAKQQLKTEAEFLNLHPSPHWAEFLDYGSDMGLDWLVIKYIDSLSVNYSQLEISLKQKIISSAEQALHSLHKTGFIHGDIKPSNLIITPEHRSTLLDMGSLAPIGSMYTQLSNSSCSPLFSALNPSLRIGDARPQDDFYALAISLQTLLGQHPFSGLALLDFAQTFQPPLTDHLGSRHMIIIDQQLRQAKRHAYRAGALGTSR